MNISYHVDIKTAFLLKKENPPEKSAARAPKTRSSGYASDFRARRNSADEWSTNVQWLNVTNLIELKPVDQTWRHFKRQGEMLVLGDSPFVVGLLTSRGAFHPEAVSQCQEVFGWGILMDPSLLY